MQNKKSLLRRLLVIYITFFIVLMASIVHGILPGFLQGAAKGLKLGNEITANFDSGTPHLIYILDNIRLKDQTIEVIPADCNDKSAIQASIKTIDLIVEQHTDRDSPMQLAFSIAGGSWWLYLLIMLYPSFYIAIITLMFIIINSLRRSIREERMLDKRNIHYLRAIGILTILSEITDNVVMWIMNLRAAKLLAGTQYTIDTSFHLSYAMIIMGILILFSAEVFAIGQNLSEEQKLTI